MNVSFLSTIVLLQACACFCLPRQEADGSEAQGNFSVSRGRRLKQVVTKAEVGQLTGDLDAIFYDLDECFYPFGGSGMGKWEVKVAKKWLFEKHGFTDEKWENFKTIFAGEKTIWDALLKVDVINDGNIADFASMICSETPYDELIQKDPELRQALLDTPGPRYILSNNWHCHCVKIVDLLGVADLIDVVIGIDDINELTAKKGELIIKPNPKFYTIAMKKMGSNRGLMVDDRYYNCEGAEEAGMAAIQMAKFIGTAAKPPSADDEDSISSQGADMELKEDSTIPIIYKWEFFPTAVEKFNFVKPSGVGEPFQPPTILPPTVAKAFSGGRMMTPSSSRRFPAAFPQVVPRLPPSHPKASHSFARGSALKALPHHAPGALRFSKGFTLSAQNDSEGSSSDVISIPALVLIGLFVGCVVSFAKFHLRRIGLATWKTPLLDAYKQKDACDQ